ncbi:hypothetical protein AUH73_05225 [archaeon 13_1_40CM_4_53_4]|nr:MAG: hypothetical protein AUH73_05225 [archaeon 13_1_40CM_4_53_4]
MSAGNGSISQRNFPIPSRKKRSSSRKLPLEEIDIIQTNKRFGYSDREIAKMLNRSLGVVGKYTRGMKPDPFTVALQPILPTQHGEPNPVTRDLGSNRPRPRKARLQWHS